MKTADQVVMQEDLWAMTLAELSPAAIERGMKRSAHRFPTYPPRDSEFLQLCQPQPEDIGHPRLEVALAAARSSKWRSHPAVWHTGLRIGTYDFRLMNPDKQARVFEDTYYAITRETAEHMEKDPKYRLEMPLLLAKPEKQDLKNTPSTKKHALEAVAKIREVLRKNTREVA